MLKIKDSVDLKELEKFGFIYKERMVRPMPSWKSIEYNGYYKDYFMDNSNENYWFYIDGSTREIIKEVWDIDTLYDLIKADLVEKV
jgi:hypothetical protein